MNSAEQDQWIEICAEVRAGLARKVEMIPAMLPSEVESLVAAIDTAMWNEQKAATYDQALAERRMTLDREAAFGG